MEMHTEILRPKLQRKVPIKSNEKGENKEALNAGGGGGVPCNARKEDVWLWFDLVGLVHRGHCVRCATHLLQFGKCRKRRGAHAERCRATGLAASTLSCGL